MLLPETVANRPELRVPKIGGTLGQSCAAGQVATALAKYWPWPWPETPEPAVGARGRERTSTIPALLSAVSKASHSAFGLADS